MERRELGRSGVEISRPVRQPAHLDPAIDAPEIKPDTAETNELGPLFLR
jgi:hypothetical protein